MPVAVMVLLVALLAGCGDTASRDVERGAPPTRAPDGAVLARVGEGVITDQQFAEEASRTPEAARGADLQARRRVLEELITEEILFQEAVRREIYRDPKVRRIMTSLLIREEVFDKIREAEIPEADLRAYFDAHTDELAVPEKVQVRRIFVRIGDERTREQAEELMEDLRNQLRRAPAKFGDLALRFSEDPFRRRGGDVGLIDRTGKVGLPDEVVDTAFALRPGQLSEVFEGGGGLNLVLVVSRRDRIERGFEQMKGTVLRRMRNEIFEERTAAFIDGIRARYDVTIDEDTLANTYVQVQAAAPHMNAAELLDVTAPRDEAAADAAADGERRP